METLIDRLEAAFVASGIDRPVWFRAARENTEWQTDEHEMDEGVPVGTRFVDHAMIIVNRLTRSEFDRVEPRLPSLGFALVTDPRVGNAKLWAIPGFGTRSVNRDRVGYSARKD